MSIISKIISYLSYWFRRLRNWLLVKSKAMAKFPELSEKYIDQAITQTRVYHQWGETSNQMPDMRISDITGIDDDEEMVEIEYEVVYKKGNSEKWIQIKVPTKTNVANNDLRKIIEDEISRKSSPPGDSFEILHIQITSIIPVNIPEPS